MTRPATGKAAVVATLDIAGLPEGPVLDPMAHPGAAEAAAFAGWETPIAPWGGFRLTSGFQIVRDGEACVLKFTLPADERSIVTLPADSRDYAVEARVLPQQEAAGPHNDRADCERAYVGIVFRQRPPAASTSFASRRRHPRPLPAQRRGMVPAGPPTGRPAHHVCDLARRPRR